jgi:hypothetical protein
MAVVAIGLAESLSAPEVTWSLVDAGFILLLGSNDRAGLAMCTALGQAGHRVSILRLAAQRTPADYSRFCAESLHIGAPDSSLSEYLAKLTDFASISQLRLSRPDRRLGL